MRGGETISSIGDLILKLDEMYSKCGDLLWFRGHSDKDWELAPFIQRDKGIHLNNERFMTNDFYMRAGVRMKEKPAKENYAGWIALMQHYGLPTRLLDWSASPLIAAYFAVYNEDADKDACIWILNPGLLNECEGFGKYIYPMDSITISKMLVPAFKKVIYKDEDSSYIENKIIACYPVECDMRIYAQQSAFTVHNSLKKLEGFNTEGIISKLIIPANRKETIAGELKICGITLRNIMPDIEHIAKEIKCFHCT